MTVYAFGCSVAHGADTQAAGNDPANIEFSYPALIAKHLGQSCENYAFCGNSNENIFHSVIKKISETETMKVLIIGWTSDVREVWECQGRTWQVIPSWCATTKNLYDPFRFFERHKFAGLNYRLCADKLDHIEMLDEIYLCLSKYKFDAEIYKEKTTHYMSTLESYCKQKNITLLETSWYRSSPNAFDISQIGSWMSENRHPNKKEHDEISQALIGFYQL